LSGNIEQGTKEPAARLVTLREHKYVCILFSLLPEAKSKEKHDVGDPMPELIMSSPYVHSKVDSTTFTTGNPWP
jgi:hypothetical protein